MPYYPPPNVTVTGGGGGTSSFRGGAVVAASNAPANVKSAADYVCDGTADEVEINSAIGSSDMVFLTEGTFNISSPIRLVSDDRQGLHGAGFATIINCSVGFSGAAAVLIDGDGTTPPGYVWVENLYIEGNNVGSASVPVDGLFVRAYHSRIRNIFARRFSGNGIRFQGYAGWATFDTMVSFCSSEQNWLNGFMFDNPRGEDIHVVACVAIHNGDASLNTSIDTVNIDTTTLSNGFNFQGASMQVTSCHAYSNNAAGILSAAARSKFVNCKLEHNRHGIYLAAGGSYSVITGCGFKGGKGTTISDHIHCEGASGNGFSTVTGCQFDHTADDGSATAKSAINLVNGNTQNMVIVGNRFDSVGWGTGVILNSGGTGGFGQLIANNLGYVTENQGFFTTAAATLAYTFAHGLSYTPPRAEITLSPLADPGAVRWWASAVDATNITVTFSAQPTTGVNIGWAVGRRGTR